MPSQRKVATYTDTFSSSLYRLSLDIAAQQQKELKGCTSFHFPLFPFPLYVCLLFLLEFYGIFLAQIVKHKHRSSRKTTRFSAVTKSKEVRAKNKGHMETTDSIQS